MKTKLACNINMYVCVEVIISYYLSLLSTEFAYTQNKFIQVWLVTYLDINNIYWKLDCSLYVCLLKIAKNTPGIIKTMNLSISFFFA